MENLQLSTKFNKKRNLSQVSQSSSTPSPMSKMANVKKYSIPGVDDLDSCTANEKDESHFNPLNDYAYI